MNIIIEIMNYVLCGTNNISVLIITIVAGIFGFIIAAIPLTIQLFEIKDNDVIKKINENKLMKKKFFDNYINTLKSAFAVIIFLVLLEIFKVNIFQNILIEVFIFVVYIIFVYIFFRSLYKLIGILNELVLTYLDIKE